MGSHRDLVHSEETTMFEILRDLGYNKSRIWTEEGTGLDSGFIVHGTTKES